MVQQAATQRVGITHAILAMAGVNIIWGIAFPITKPALADIPPFTFATFRFMLALVVLVPFAGRRWLELVRGPERWQMLWLGLSGFTIVQLAQMAGLKLSPAADIALLAALSPIWITLLAWPMLGERPNRRSWAGLALAVAGLLLILWPQQTGQQVLGIERIIGDIVYIGGTLSWALYNILGKNLMARYEPIGLTTAATVIGTIGLIPFALWEIGSGQTLRFSMAGAFAIGYTALLVTVVGFLVLFWAYRHASATQVAITMYLQPVAGVIVAWLWLGEPLSAAFLLGALLVLTGVGVVTTNT